MGSGRLNLRVAVVGGGISGTATALLFARMGARVTVFEQDTAPSPAGAGIALQPNGLSVLYGLGLDDQLQRQSFRTRYGVIDTCQRGAITFEFPTFGYGLDHALGITRRRLMRVLHDAVLAEPGISIRYGNHVTHVNTGGLVVARAQGHRGSSLAPDYDIVVGADGTNSVVRQCAGFSSRRTTTGHLALRMLVPGEPFGQYVWERLTDWGIMITAPMGDGSSYVGLSASRGPVREALSKRDLHSLDAATNGDPIVRDALSLALSNDQEYLSVTRIELVKCKRWVDGRLVLIGDAAHAMPPYLGQGANSALVDAYVLAREAALLRGQVSVALNRYEQRRHLKVSRIQQESYWYGRLIHGAIQPPFLQVRNAMLRGVIRLGSPYGWFLRRVQQEDPGQIYKDLRSESRTARESPGYHEGV